MKEILLTFSGKVVQVSSLNSIRNANHLIHAMDVKQYAISNIKQEIFKESTFGTFFFFLK